MANNTDDPSTDGPVKDQLPGRCLAMYSGNSDQLAEGQKGDAALFPSLLQVSHFFEGKKGTQLFSPPSFRCRISSGGRAA